jgi:hypothetical protein
MSAAETLDDHPYDAHMRRDPMHDAGIGIIFLTELPAHSAECFIAPIVAWLQAAGRTVAVQIVWLDGRAARLNDAVRAALDVLSLPLVLITTAVEPWSPAHLEPLLDAIDRCDHVIGRRPAGTWRRIRRWIACSARRLIFAVPVLDVHSPCRLHRAEKLGAIPMQSGSSYLDIEILAKATFLGHLLNEVDVPPLAGWVVQRGRWSDRSAVLRHPEFRPTALTAHSVPAEDAQGQVESAYGPGREDRDRLEDVVVEQSGALEHNQAKRGDELGQGERLDERLGALAEVLRGEKNPGEQIHRQHDQVHESTDCFGGRGPAGDQEPNAREGQGADDVDQKED